MQAVIMAAGEGKRMQPLTYERPKPLITVAGKTIIEHVLDVLPEAIDEVVIVVGYKADMITSYLGEQHNGRFIRYVHQWMPAGTAHALSIARPFLTGKFLLLNADDILGKEALEEATRHPLALVVAPHEEAQKFGVVALREDGTIERIIEKPEHPPTNLVSTGAMVLDQRLFSYPAPKHASGEYYMTDPLAELVRDHRMLAVEQPLWIPVGSPEDIPKAEAMLRAIEANAAP